MSTVPMAHWAFCHRRSHHGLPESRMRIRLRSIFTNGDRCPTTPACSSCVTAIGIATPSRVEDLVHAEDLRHRKTWSDHHAKLRACRISGSEGPGRAPAGIDGAG